jgi:hypothetical protein
MRTLRTTSASSCHGRPVRLHKKRVRSVAMEHIPILSCSSDILPWIDDGRGGEPLRKTMMRRDWHQHQRHGIIDTFDPSISCSISFSYIRLTSAASWESLPVFLTRALLALDEKNSVR